MDNNQNNSNSLNSNSNNQNNFNSNSYDPNNSNPYNTNPNNYNPNNYNPNIYSNNNPNNNPYNYGQQQNYNPYYPPYDPTNEPMTLKDWMVTFLLLMIPIANFILPFIWAFGSGVNKSKKTYFQACFLMSLIIFGLWIVFFIVFAGLIASLAANI